MVNSTVFSNRGGGAACSSCYPVQTFRRFDTGAGLADVVDKVGGTNPAGEDTPLGTLTGGQSVSTIFINASGIIDVDFGFNFNTIVNTNEDGQGSFDQFIINANNLDESGLDIEANAIFDLGTGEDVSIFVIPSSSDPMGLTADGGFASGYFDIFYNDTVNPKDLTSNNLIIDGRTQTAYSGNTNLGSVGASRNTVGTTMVNLPNYERLEIQIQRNAGDVIVNNGNNNVIRHISIFANNNSGIRIGTGSLTKESNLIGVNALGNNAGNIDIGIENQGGNIQAIGNYVSTNSDSGIVLNGGTSSLVQLNHITTNGITSCDDNIRISGGSGIIIQQNLIENAATLGINATSYFNGLSLTENTITFLGRIVSNCGAGPENMGVELNGGNSTISYNVFHSNGGTGFATTGNGTANTITQNSFYNNGTTTDALGIDLLGDGVTLNDSGDVDSGFNNLLNFPIIETANINGTSVIVTGWSIPGATMEFFLTDISEGTAVAGANQLGLSTDYGEGQVFIGSFVEGSGADTNSKTSSYLDLDNNTDNTNQFTFIFSIPLGVTPGKDITATATVANSTSEFSPMSTLKTFTVITNRRITYRIKKN
ncbi:NosD domain-containing protein [Maribacter sp. 4U21]|uniref:NosD domain-containing protein n=1 Tax=Maribacter sp. 4U21 TaxID=1889779 RepID=UPI000C1451A0|nr:right-handed parallel beta-helix repeat-containing protein [Maribacter sp. 4U21]